jgi:hypothetical protein
LPAGPAPFLPGHFWIQQVRSSFVILPIAILL